jgi:hypothetical protein
MEPSCGRKKEERYRAHFWFALIAGNSNSAKSWLGFYPPWSVFASLSSLYWIRLPFYLTILWFEGYIYNHYVSLLGKRRIRVVGKKVWVRVFKLRHFEKRQAPPPSKKCHFLRHGYSFKRDGWATFNFSMKKGALPIHRMKSRMLCFFKRTSAFTSIPVNRCFKVFVQR